MRGEVNPAVRLVDFRNYDKNSFIAINQFRLLTPGASRQGIIPNIVLFLNGLPLVVVEAKDFDVAEPLSEAFLQVTRYANTREDDYGVKEGEEWLFHYNLFSIRADGILLNICLKLQHFIYKLGFGFGRTSYESQHGIRPCS